MERLPPRVQNTEKAHFGAEMGGIGGHLQQSCGAGIEQEIEQELLILPSQRDQSVRDAEHQVEVADWEQFPFPRTQPLLACVGLAFRTMAIPAGNGEHPITCLGLNRFAVSV